MIDCFPFKHQPHKMVKHTKTNRRQQPTNGLSVFNRFVGLALKGLRCDIRGTSLRLDDPQKFSSD